MKIEKKYRPTLVFYALFIVFAIVFVNYILYKDKKQAVLLYKEYPSLKKEQSVNARIYRIFDQEGFRINMYYANIQLNTGDKIGVFVEHNPGPKKDFREVLASGDSIVKKAGSDSLFVIKTRNGKTIVYDFILKARSE